MLNSIDRKNNEVLEFHSARFAMWHAAVEINTVKIPVHCNKFNDLENRAAREVLSQSKRIALFGRISKPRKKMKKI